MSNFDVLEIMSNRNLDIKSFPVMNNLMNARTGKDGWGAITVAVDNGTAARIMRGDLLVAVLLVADGKQFQEVKEEIGA